MPAWADEWHCDICHGQGENLSCFENGTQQRTHGRWTGLELDRIKASVYYWKATCPGLTASEYREELDVKVKADMCMPSVQVLQVVMHAHSE